MVTITPSFRWAALDPGWPLLDWYETLSMKHLLKSTRPPWPLFPKASLRDPAPPFSPVLPKQFQYSPFAQNKIGMLWIFHIKICCPLNTHRLFVSLCRSSSQLPFISLLLPSTSSVWPALSRICFFNKLTGIGLRFVKHQILTLNASNPCSAVSF